MESKSYFNQEAVILWKQFLQGNEDSFAQLMRIFSPQMFRYGIRINDNQEFIEDCLQNIFCELWNRRSFLKPTESVKFYLFKALRNRIFRDQMKWSRHDDIDADYNFEVSFDVQTDIIKQEVSEELRSKLDNLMLKLSKRQKEIIYLRFYEGLSQEKIAEIMGLNVQSVYNLLHESILRLRTYWIKSPLYYCL
ncbi:sigma-70 family RNA polymerase sigma factor [Pedobacter agri]|uniref:RNA polymerase sigma factor n=1 Tax=Pedobacter agri TaxID=454586 RepID=UPI00292DD283|nr:sigma-70 family RNA polymerase sigma factor [Pedobacter agri]